MQVRVHGDQHIGKRQNQEDAYVIDSGIGLFVVADGLGGYNAGEVASQMAVETFLCAVKRGESLLAALSEAGAKVFVSAHMNQEWVGMATTLTALHCTDAGILWVHVGDSRLYLLSKGNLKQVTTDHTVFSPLDDTYVLSSCLGRGLGGSWESVRSFQAVQSGDKFLLCSDGLCVVPDWKIKEILQEFCGQVAVDRLIQTALHVGGKDNITVVVVEILSP